MLTLIFEQVFGSHPVQRMSRNRILFPSQQGEQHLDFSAALQVQERTASTRIVNEATKQRPTVEKKAPLAATISTRVHKRRQLVAAIFVVEKLFFWETRKKAIEVEHGKNEMLPRVGVIQLVSS